MNKISIFAIAVFVAIFVGLFATQVKEKDTDVTRAKTKVGLIAIGHRNDHSWNQAHVDGLTKTAEKLNLEIDIHENIPEEDTCETVIEEMIENGDEIIIATSFGYGKYIQNQAKKHPDVKFFHATGIKEAPNLATYFGRIYQMRYLAGIVAGYQTKTGNIGYVAAFDISEVIRGINAFALGVKKANPNATVHVKWSKSWNDEEISRKATRELLDKHDIDVLTVHSDALSPFEIAVERGVWIVGYNIDNSTLYPKNFLTAPVWDWEAFYTPRILEVLQKKFVSKHYWEGAESGIPSLAPLTEHVSPKVRESIDREMELLKSGTFDVFYGPVVDNQDSTRILEGESMTDNDMLNNFNWFVKGVVIDE